MNSSTQQADLGPPAAKLKAIKLKRKGGPTPREVVAKLGAPYTLPWSSWPSFPERPPVFIKTPIGQ